MNIENFSTENYKDQEHFLNEEDFISAKDLNLGSEEMNNSDKLIVDHLSYTKNRDNHFFKNLDEALDNLYNPLSKFDSVHLLTIHQECYDFFLKENRGEMNVMEKINILKFLCPDFNRMTTKVLTTQVESVLDILIGGTMFTTTKKEDINEVLSYKPGNEDMSLMAFLYAREYMVNNNFIPKIVGKILLCSGTIINYVLKIKHNFKLTDAIINLKEDLREYIPKINNFFFWPLYTVSGNSLLPNIEKINIHIEGEEKYKYLYKGQHLIQISVKSNGVQIITNILSRKQKVKMPKDFPELPGDTIIDLIVNGIVTPNCIKVTDFTCSDVLCFKGERVAYEKPLKERLSLVKDIIKTSEVALTKKMEEGVFYRNKTLVYFMSDYIIGVNNNFILKKCAFSFNNGDKKISKNLITYYSVLNDRGGELLVAKTEESKVSQVKALDSYKGKYKRYEMEDFVKGVFQTNISNTFIDDEFVLVTYKKIKNDSNISLTGLNIIAHIQKPKKRTTIRDIQDAFYQNITKKQPKKRELQEDDEGSEDSDNSDVENSPKKIKLN